MLHFVESIMLGCDLTFARSLSRDEAAAAGTFRRDVRKGGNGEAASERSS
jgi:hypothetical protein